MVRRIAIHEVFSRPISGLGRVADESGIPENQPTIFHPDLIATIPQKFLP